MCRAIASWIVACNNKKRLRGERERERERRNGEEKELGWADTQPSSLTFFFLSSLIAS
jgi:hypothetical protein